MLREGSPPGEREIDETVFVSRTKWTTFPEFSKRGYDVDNNNNNEFFPRMVLYTRYWFQTTL